MREFELLKQVFAANRELPARVTIPPGDDMGAIAWAPETGELLVTVDQVAEDVHFSGDTPVELVARKAIARNVSDVAAMGCQPVAAVAAACLPRHMQDAQIQTLCDQLRIHAARWGCPLIGGDVSVWDQKLIITVTVLAQRWHPTIAPVLRSGAKPGDKIYVTGKLGGSFASERHLRFEPRLNAARQLVMEQGGRYRPTAMIDLSDGLARDLGHLCEMSKLSALVQLKQIPIHDDVLRLHPQEETWRHALGEGEDYELCFTVGAEAASILPGELDGVSITCIGEMISESQTPKLELIMPDGSMHIANHLGWEHGS